MPLSQITQLSVLLKRMKSSLRCLYNPGCGIMHRNTVGLPGATLLKEMDAAFLGSYQMSKAPLLGVGACTDHLFPLWNLVGFILHKSCVCCDNYEFTYATAQWCPESIVSLWSPATSDTLSVPSSVLIPEAWQEGVSCGCPIQRWAFCGLSFSVPLLVVGLCQFPSTANRFSDESWEKHWSVGITTCLKNQYIMSI